MCRAHGALLQEALRRERAGDGVRCDSEAGSRCDNLDTPCRSPAPQRAGATETALTSERQRRGTVDVGIAAGRIAAGIAKSNGAYRERRFCLPVGALVLVSILLPGCVSY